MPRVRYNKIPLRRRDGTLVAYTLLDPEDYARFNDRRWSLQATGYAQGWDRHIKKVRTLHREIMALPIGDYRHVDHINGDKLDNRRANLRAAHQVWNHRNYHKPQKDNKAGVLYVSVHRSGYVVRVGRKYYGKYQTLDAAAEVAGRLAEERRCEVDAAYRAAV